MSETSTERAAQFNRLLDSAYNLLEKTEQAEGLAGDPLERARLRNHVEQIKQDIVGLETRLNNPKDTGLIPSAYPFVGGESFASYENLLKDIARLVSKPDAPVRVYAPGGMPEVDLDSVLGREEELEELHRALENTGSLAVVALSGTGKSTLTWTYLSRLALGDLGLKTKTPLPEVVKPRAIYWQRVNRNEDISWVLGEFFLQAAPDVALAAAAWEKQPPGEQIELFLRELTARPYFIVLDSFEVLMDPSTLQPYNEFFGQLLERLIVLPARCPSRVIITSWDVPKGPRGRSPQVLRLGGLSDKTGAQLLEQLGLTNESETTRRKASRVASGNPYALHLLADLVQQEEGYLIDYLGDNSLWDNENAGLISKVYERLTPARQEALIRLYPWRLPVGASELAGLEAVIAAEDGKPARPLNYWEQVRRDCEQQNVINGQRDEENKRRVGRLPDLMHRFLETQVLSDKQRQDLHRAAADYYSQLPVPPREERHNFQSVQPLFEVIWQLANAKEIDRAVQLFFDEGLADDIFRWGVEGRLVDLYELLLASNPTNSIDRARLTGYLGLSYWALHNLTRAIECHSETLKLSQKLNNKLIEGSALGSLGLCYQRLNDYRKAMDYHQKHLKLAREISDLWGEGQALGRLGTCYRSLGNYKKGLELQLERLPISAKAEDRRGEGNAYNEIGICYLRLGNLEQAKKYLFDSLVIRLQISDRWGEGESLKDLGLLAQESGQFKEALEYLLSHLEISLELGNPRFILEALNRVGRAYQDLGDTEKAAQYYLQGIERVKDRQELLTEAPILTTLADCYAQIGEPDKADKFYDAADRVAERVRLGRPH